MGDGRARRYIAVDSIQAVSVVGSRSASTQLLAAARRATGILTLAPTLPLSKRVRPRPSVAHLPAFGQAGAENEQLGGRTDGPTHSTSEMARCTAFLLLLPGLVASLTFNERH